MTALFVKSAGGNSNAAGTWSNVSSAGVDNSGPPTAADDLIPDSVSGQLTANAALACRSIDCSSGNVAAVGTYANTLTHNSSIIVSIGDATAGAGNVALRFVAGMTYSKNATGSQLKFVSTSATQQTITTGGKALGLVVFNATSNGSWLLSDAFTADGGSTAGLTLTQGTLDTNGQTLSLTGFTSTGSATRALTLGASAITLSGQWNVSSTGMTLTANTSTITLTGSSGFFGGGVTYATVVLSGAAPSIAGANTLGTLTRTGTAAKTNTFTVIANQTVTGTFNCNGNSVTNRMLVLSDTLGTARTITAATVSVTNADFQDMTGAGAGSWDLSAITGKSGDCGGNSGITFTTAATQTATGTASFAWSTHGWTSRVPLPQDDVVINNAFVAGRTVTQDMPRAGKSITFGCTGSPTFAPNVAWSMYGSIDVTGVATVSGSGVSFEGRGSYTITQGGATWGITATVNSLGGTYSLAAAFTSSTTITLTRGEFDDGGFSTTCSSFASNNSNTRTLTLTGTFTVTGTGSVWLVSTSGLTQDLAGSTLVVSNTAAATKSVTASGMTLGIVRVTGNDVQVNTNGSTCVGLEINNAGLAEGVQLSNGSTTTVGYLTTNGIAGNLALLKSTVNGTAATITLSSAGPIITDYMSIQDITLTAGKTWYAGSHSTDAGGNSSNIIFTDPPAANAGGNLLLLGVG